MSSCIAFNMFFVFRDLANNLRLVCIKYLKVAKKKIMGPEKQL